MRFKVFNRGKSPLQNISVSISRIDLPHAQSDTVFLGVIPVGGSRDLPFTITPIINANAPYVDDRQIDSWIVEISATNGTFEQRDPLQADQGLRSRLGVVGAEVVEKTDELRPER